MDVPAGAHRCDKGLRRKGEWARSSSTGMESKGSVNSKVDLPLQVVEKYYGLTYVPSKFMSLPNPPFACKDIGPLRK